MSNPLVQYYALVTDRYSFQVQCHVMSPHTSPIGLGSTYFLHQVSGLEWSWVFAHDGVLGGKLTLAAKMMNVYCTSSQVQSH